MHWQPRSDCINTKARTNSEDMLRLDVFSGA